MSLLVTYFQLKVKNSNGCLNSCLLLRPAWLIVHEFTKTRILFYDGLSYPTVPINLLKVWVLGFVSFTKVHSEFTLLALCYCVTTAEQTVAELRVISHGGQ